MDNAAEGPDYNSKKGSTASLRPGWLLGARWFAGQFTVVVAGILAALALQAWYEGQQRADEWHDALLVVKADMAADTLTLGRSSRELQRQIAGLEVLMNPAKRDMLSSDSLAILFNTTAPYDMRYEITAAGYERFNRLDATNQQDERVLRLVTRFYNRDLLMTTAWDEEAKQNSINQMTPYLVRHLPFASDRVARQSSAEVANTRFMANDAQRLLGQEEFLQLLLQHHYIKVFQQYAYEGLLERARMTIKEIDESVGRSSR